MFDLKRFKIHFRSDLTNTETNANYIQTIITAERRQ
jgi:hypothetical protein